MNIFLCILTAAAAALVILLSVIIIRALLFKPKKKTAQPIEEIHYDGQAAGEHLSQMLRCKTVSYQDKELVDWNEFEKFIELIPTLYPTAAEKLEFERIGKTGLIYRWAGKSAEKASVLMAHYDVVPAEADGWSFDPFCGEIRDGVVLGRGALDTKSTLCAIFEAADRMIGEGFVPQNDIYLCFSGTEEIAGEGAYEIVEHLHSLGVHPQITVDEGGAIVNGVFPGVKQPCAVVGISEKGQMAIKLTVKGGAGHASSPPKTNPFGELAKAVVAIENNPFKTRMTDAARLLFSTLGRYSGFGLRLVFGNLRLFTPLLKSIARTLGNDFNAMMRTTSVFTMAKGSAASNVLPKEASITCDVRILPGETSEQVLEHFRKVINNENVIIEPIFTVEPSPCSPTGCEQWNALERAVNETWDDVIVSPYLMMARSDSSAYTAICEHVYRFAPMKLSSEERAMIHGIDEQIPAKKIASAAEFYHRLIKQL